MYRFFYLTLICSVMMGLQSVFAADYPIDSSISSRIEKLSVNEKLRFKDPLHPDTFKADTRLRVIIKLRPQPPTKRNDYLRSPAGRVQLRQEVAETIDSVASDLDSQEVRILNKFSYTNSFAVKTSLAGLERLLADERVQSVHEDRALHPMTSQGVELIEGVVPRTRYPGTGVAIAILDTGIDYNHPMLGGGGFPNVKVVGGYDTGDDDADPIDYFGHGTAVAGIAAGYVPVTETGSYSGGVAPGAQLYALKISHSDESGSPTSYAWASDIIEALEWCITHQYDNPASPIMIANISFGLGGYASPCDTDSYAEIGKETIQNVNLAGISIFASSGNNGYTQSLSLPACYSGVISVGAVYDGAIGTLTFDICSEEAEADRVACYSNSANYLDLLAPSHNAHTTDTVGDGGYSFDDYHQSFGGTSASSPYAAGSAVIIQSAYYVHRGSFLPPAAVRSMLIASGDPLLDHRNSTTKPRVNVHAALRAFLLTGDVNGNGEIDTADAIASLKLLSGPGPDPLSLYSDVNDDNRVGLEEALYVLRYTAGMICMAGNLDVCTTQEGCETADGFWYGDTCHGDPSCNISDLAQCNTERSCTFVGGYWLQNQSICVPDPTVEIETNDTIETANTIYFDVPVSGSLFEISDVDSFALNVDAPSVGRVFFSTTFTSTFWLISIYDENGNMISRHDVGNNDSFDVALPNTGTFYLQVSVDSTHSSDTYTLLVSAIDEYPLSNIETEPNDTKEHADSIAYGEPMTGQLMDVADEDWFFLDAETAADITIFFSTSVASTYWLISVYDENDQLIAEDDVGNNGSLSTWLPHAGRFFITVKNDSVLSNDQYRLNVANQ